MYLHARILWLMMCVLLQINLTSLSGCICFFVWYAANTDIIAVLKSVCGCTEYHGKYQKKYQTKTIKPNENTTHNIGQKNVKLNSSLRTFKVVKCRWNCE